MRRRKIEPDIPEAAIPHLVQNPMGDLFYDKERKLIKTPTVWEEYDGDRITVAAVSSYSHMSDKRYVVLVTKGGLSCIMEINEFLHRFKPISTMEDGVGRDKMNMYF